MTPEDSLNAGSATLDANYTNSAPIRTDLSSSNVLSALEDLPALDTLQHTTASSQGFVSSASLDQQQRAGIAHEAFKLLMRVSCQRLLPLNMLHNNVRRQEAEQLYRCKGGEI